MSLGSSFWRLHALKFPSLEVAGLPAGWLRKEPCFIPEDEEIFFQ